MQEVEVADNSVAHVYVECLHVSFASVCLLKSSEIAKQENAVEKKEKGQYEERRRSRRRKNKVCLSQLISDVRLLSVISCVV